MKAAYNEVEETPDTIDAANEARAAEVSKADAVTKGFRYQRRKIYKDKEKVQEKKLHKNYKMKLMHNIKKMVI